MVEMERKYPGQTDELVSKRESDGCAVARRAAAEGMVLLENNGILPLAPGTKIALYGLGARHTIKGGSGSGDVNSRHVVSVEEGLENAGFEIVNKEYLKLLDNAYKKAWDEWMKKIYAAAGPEEDPEKLYDAHVRYTLNTPSLPIPPSSFIRADVVVYVISRTSGEGADRKDGEGDYLLTADETDQIRTLWKNGKPVIVLLNVGGVIDLSFMDDMMPAAAILMGQAGCESGNAVADILSGKVNPSGRLTDTWAYRYMDYPSSEQFSYRNGNVLEEDYTDGIYVGYRYFDTFGVKPRYPFGYGLSYTTFETAPGQVFCHDGTIRAEITVRNTGAAAGAMPVLVYAACPARKQKKEFKRLAGFAKTRVLNPGESETVEVAFGLEMLASYQPGTASYILEDGRYTLLAGEPQTKPFFALDLPKTVTLCTLPNVCELLSALDEIEPDDEQIQKRDEWLAAHSEHIGSLSLTDEDVACAGRHMSPAQAGTNDGVLEQAKQILGNLTEDEKIRLTVGAPGIFTGEMIGDSGMSVPGAAGETVRLSDKGVPGMVLCDGPAGLRIQLRYEIDPENGQVYRLKRFETLENRFFGVLRKHENAVSMWQFATAVPAGTLLAQSFDVDLMKEVGETIAREMVAFGVALWLAPGMNIHRNPLCGRNYEYYSEDPLLSGKMAAAITQGVQRTVGLGTTIKHYACNNQEENRCGVSANISERALREIYLKGFEIAVRESQPMSIMTSYNRINYVHTANSIDLCTRVAREEWGFSGLIMTDWTTTNGGHGASAAKCIRAGNDLVMPGRDSDRNEIRDALHGDGPFLLSKESLDRSALRIVYASLLSARALQ
ncbi:MAG: glycoside hydrolase family 3 C-terminal domain-containing protein [Clostridia bacterium]|nr:glycoside hydrolase family 3 C-terminal domain-containing protein [Clostridia bacterium]